MQCAALNDMSLCGLGKDSDILFGSVSHLGWTRLNSILDTKPSGQSANYFVELTKF